MDLFRRIEKALVLTVKDDDSKDGEGEAQGEQGTSGKDSSGADMHGGEKGGCGVEGGGGGKEGGGGGGGGQVRKKAPRGIKATLRGHTSTTTMGALFRQLDTNGDGVLSKEGSCA